MLRRRVAVVVVAVVVVAAAIAVTPLGDVDGDGLSLATEFGAGTDPFAADSDGDGLDDGAERAAGADPLAADTDGDGLDDGPEVHEHGTNATVRDTDDDGLLDAREVADLQTDATVADTDGDGLRDGIEVTELWTSPTAGDTDADGLDDGAEVRRYGTDPRVVDSDGDRLEDGAEVEQFDTDPLAADTDDDGLRDGREQFGLDTSPTDPDTDGDGLDDGAERELGTDPLARDTDGDGLGDGVEAADAGPLADADPLRTDVFVELDYMRGERPDPEAVALVVDRYANAPVENPDGSTGIALHVVVDDAITREPRTNGLDVVRLRTTHFDNEGRGYHHAIAVEDARSDGDGVVGFATTGELVVQTDGGDDATYSTREQAHVLMHELGHSLGLLPTLYAGIDSREVAYDDYRSAMNYNAPFDSVHYSDGPAFDDWAYIDANMDAPPTVPWLLPGPNATAERTATARDGAKTPVCAPFGGTTATPSVPATTFEAPTVSWVRDRSSHE